MWSAISRWRRRRILRRTAIPDALWNEATALRPFLAIYDVGELSRLREKVVLFLHAKAIVGARGHEVTPLQRVVIALEACVLILELDMVFYDGFENVIVYPGEFVPEWEWEDEAGVVHRNDEPMAGEAMPGGPVVLSWPDVAASADWETAGMNLVIHEFAHKIDMRNGEADGCPPLPAGMPVDVWRETLTTAYEDFCARVNRLEATDIDAYAAESPAEFFAVLSEVFFADPLVLRDEYPRLYEQFVVFYRQNPAARVSAFSSASG
jgi:Mlc titration factor MtfA (ptsG expression regulator)